MTSRFAAHPARRFRRRGKIPSVAPSTRIQEDGFSTSSDSNGRTLLPPRQRTDAASRSRPHPHKVRTSSHWGRRPRYVPMGNVHQVRHTPPFRLVSNSLRGEFRRTVPLEHSRPKLRRLRVQLSPQRQSPLYASLFPPWCFGTTALDSTKTQTQIRTSSRYQSPSIEPRE
jgi:hypothetical protein